MAKKILIVGHYPPPYGGIAEVIQHTCSVLRDSNYQVRVMSVSGDVNENIDGVIVSSYHADVKSLFRFGAKVGAIVAYFWSIFRAGFPIKMSLGRAIEAACIESVIRDYQPDVVSFYSMLNAFMLPLLRKRLKAAARIHLSIYGAIYQDVESYRKHSSFYNSILSSSDLVSSSSMHCASSSDLIGFSSQNIKVVYCGVDIYKFREADQIGRLRKELEWPLAKKVVLYFGQLDLRLGVRVFMDAIPVIADLVPDAYFVIAGAKVDPALFEEIMKVQARWPEKVLVVANVPPELKPLYFQACDLFAAPSLDHRSCGQISIQEAMACGKPVVASRVGGIPEVLVDGQNGVLIEPGDSRQLAQRIVDLLGRPEEMRALGARGRKDIVERLSMEAISGDILALYQSAQLSGDKVIHE